MKQRRCSVRITIDTGKVKKTYSLQPAPAQHIPADLAVGFRLECKSESLSPVYLVGVLADGTARCHCPSWSSADPCKHVAALTAAGLLPVHLIQLLADRSKLLDVAEAQVKKISEAAIEEQMIYQHDTKEMREQITDLENQLRSAEARALELQAALTAIPLTRSRRRKAVAA